MLPWVFIKCLHTYTYVLSLLLFGVTFFKHEYLLYVTSHKQSITFLEINIVMVLIPSI